MNWTQAIMGENAVQVPFNFVRQSVDNARGLILGQNNGVELAFGSEAPHVMVLGDMIFRPHIVIESEHLIGVGAAGIITSSSFCDIEEWANRGKVIFNLREGGYK